MKFSKTEQTEAHSCGSRGKAKYKRRFWKQTKRNHWKEKERNLRAVADYTGLTENAILALKDSEMFECYDRSQKKILSDMLSDESCLHQIVNSIYLYLKATEEQVHEAEELLKGEAELDLRDADSSDMELCLFRASRAVEDYMKHLKHEKLKELSVEVDIENL